MNRWEQQQQIAIVSWVRTVSPSTKIWHTANGGLRSKREASLLKAMGVMAGVWDLTLVAEPPGPALAFLEVKSPDGKLSPEQKEFQFWMDRLGIPNAVVRNIDEARVALRAWNVPMREAVTA